MKRLLIYLLLATMLGCNSPSNPSPQLSLAQQIEIELARGDDFWEEGDYVTANVFYTRAIVLLDQLPRRLGQVSPDELDMGSRAYFARARSIHCSKSYIDALADYSKAWRWEQWYGVPNGMGQTEGSLPEELPDGYANEYLRDIIFCRATLFLDMGEPGKAISDLHEAIRLNSSAGDLYFWRGLAYEANGEQEKAAADFLKAEDLGYSKQSQQTTRSREAQGSPRFRRPVQVLERDPDSLRGSP